jgi:hypothetical protein
MDTEITRLLERGVDALERLAQDPVIDFEVAPAQCPHCNQTDPIVRVEEKSAQGSLSGFVIQCGCTHCHNVFYAVPFQFQCVKTVAEVQAMRHERAEISNGVNR